MEGTKDQSSNSVGGSLLRYPLRSVTRSVRAIPLVTKSMGEFDLSGKKRVISSSKSFTNLTKSASSPHGIPSGYLTPSSENEKNGLNSQMNNDTPMSITSKSSHRRKFCVLFSSSYWLSQIKLSESASKHVVSIGFFRLALESGAEPLHRIREELKSYVLKHNLLEEFENATKDLLNGYNIHEDFEKLQISERSSQLLEDLPQNSIELVKLSAVVPRARNLKPKFQSANTLAEANKKEVQKKTPSTKSSLRNSENAALSIYSHVNPKKLQMNNAKSNHKLPEKSLVRNEVDDSSNEEPKLDDKENLGVDIVDAFVGRVYRRAHSTNKGEEKPDHETQRIETEPA